MTTWTPATAQGETWTEIEGGRIIRVFSPLVFSRRPVFDTGPSSGIWDAAPTDAETWTNL